MAIVIAILLALILVAIMSSNKAASDSVWRVIRIGLFVSMICLSWLILVGYGLFYYFSYSDQGWYHVVGIVVIALIPPALVWMNWKYLIDMFKTDNKALFKQLSYILIGSILYVAVGIGFKELTQDIPNLGWIILFVICGATFAALMPRALEKGWRKAFTFPKEPFDEAYDQWKKWRQDEYKAWDDEELARDKLSESEFSNAFDEHENRLNALDEKRDKLQVELQNTKRENYVLYTFYYSLVLIGFGTIFHVWEFAIDWVMTFEYVKGRMWVAVATVIFVPLAVIGFIAGIYEDRKNKA
jgi:hypothetical protein